MFLWNYIACKWQVPFSPQSYSTLSTTCVCLWSILTFELVTVQRAETRNMCWHIICTEGAWWGSNSILDTNDSYRHDKVSFYKKTGSTRYEHKYEKVFHIWWGKFSQKHSYKYMAKWWCLLAMGGKKKLCVLAYSDHLQVLTTFLLKEFKHTMGMAHPRSISHLLLAETLIIMMHMTKCYRR